MTSPPQSPTTAAAEGTNPQSATSIKRIPSRTFGIAASSAPLRISYPLGASRTTAGSGRPDAFAGCGKSGIRVSMAQVARLKVFALLTATTMLLGTYVLAALRRRLGGVLDAWQ